VTAITEVQRMEGEMITLQNLFEFKIDHMEADRTVIGRLEATGLRPTFLPRFERHGVALPIDIFGGAEQSVFGVNGAEPMHDDRNAGAAAW
jgi:pilus assembly protein CpaF